MLARDGYVVQQFLGDARPIAEYLVAIERNGVPLFHTFQGVKNSIQALIAPDGFGCPRHLHAQLPESAPIEMGRARHGSDLSLRSAPRARTRSRPPDGAAPSTFNARRTPRARCSFTSSTDASREPPSIAGCWDSTRSARRSSDSRAARSLRGHRRPRRHSRHSSRLSPALRTLKTSPRCNATASGGRADDGGAGPQALHRCRCSACSRIHQTGCVWRCGRAHPGA